MNKPNIVEVISEEEAKKRARAEMRAKLTLPDNVRSKLDNNKVVNSSKPTTAIPNT